MKRRQPRSTRNVKLIPYTTLFRSKRRRLYKTSLTPRAAKLLLDRAEAIRVKLSQGRDYARWTAEEQFAFIRDVLAFLSEIPVFAIETKLGRKKNFDDWPMLLRWWLAKSTLARQPRTHEVNNWYKSEERCEGDECYSRCRTWWVQAHY